MPRARTRKRKSQHPSADSFFSGVAKLGVGLCLIMIMVAVSLWLLWQQVSVATDLSALVLLNENRQPQQVVVTQYVTASRQLLVVVLPLNPESTSNTSVQNEDFISDIMLEVGLPLDQVQTLSAAPLSTEEQVKSALFNHPPQNLHYWSKLKWQWILDHDETDMQMVSSPAEVANTRLVKHLRSNADFTCAVAIVNTTSTAGLASVVATVIENGGKRVVQITNGPQYNQSQVFFSKNECEESATEVSAITPLHQAPQRNAGITLQYRADVVIFLGNDF